MIPFHSIRVAGVDVVVTPHDEELVDEDSADAGGKVDIEAAVRRLVRRLRAREAAVFRAVTDARGAFQVTGLPVVSCGVSGRKDGFTIDGDSQRPDAVVALVARPDVRLPIEVLLPDGRPPDHARITLSRGRETTERPWRPDAPSVSISTGSWTVAGVAGDRDELHAPPQDVTIEPGAPPAPVTLRMVSRPGVAVTVRISDEEEPQRDGVTVYVLRATGGRPPKSRRLAEEGTQQTAWPGTPAVVFVTTPGGYVVAAGRSGSMPSVMQSIDIPEEIVPLELALPPIDAKDSMTVRVLGPGGDPVRRAGFDLNMHTDTPGQDTSVPVDVIAMRDGSWRLARSFDLLSGQRPAPPMSQLDLSALRVSGTDFGSMTAPLSRGQLDVTVRFDAPAVLHLAVPGLVGSAVEGALEVILGAKLPNGAWDFSDRYNVFDIDGCVRIGPVAPGAYEALGFVRPIGASGGRVVATHAHVMLRPGLNEGILPLPRVCDVAAVSEKDATLRLRMMGEPGTMAAEFGSNDIEAEAGEDGHARFERVPFGRYMYMDDTWGVATIVSVPVAGELHFEHRPADSLLVFVSDATGALPRAGLAEGDFIVEINGEPISLEGDYSERVEALRGQQVALTVLRGSGHARVTVAGEDFAERNGVSLLNAWVPK